MLPLPLPPARLPLPLPPARLLLDHLLWSQQAMGAPEAMDTSAGCDDEMVNAFLAGIMVDDPEEQPLINSVWLLLSFS